MVAQGESLKLERGFFENSTVAVARELLGCRLMLDGVEGRVVETEAYLGSGDAASHAARGPTPRNQAMFGPVGHLYVYRSYGIHHCLNLVAHPQGQPGAVLIRALEPVRGQSRMRRRRGRDGIELCNGPGKLCQALGIDMSFDGQDLMARGGVEIYAGAAEEETERGPRVGISKAREFPYRFWLRGNPHVSRHRTS